MTHIHAAYGCSRREYLDQFLPLKNFLMRERQERGDPKTMDMNKLKVGRPLGAGHGHQ